MSTEGPFPLGRGSAVLGIDKGLELLGMGIGECTRRSGVPPGVSSGESRGTFGFVSFESESVGLALFDFSTNPHIMGMTYFDRLLGP